MFVLREKSNESLFTPQELPSYDAFTQIINKNLICDYPITSTDIKRSLAICGKDPAK